MRGRERGDRWKGEREGERRGIPSDNEPRRKIKSDVGIGADDVGGIVCAIHVPFLSITRLREGREEKRRVGGEEAEE